MEFNEELAVQCIDESGKSITLSLDYIKPLSLEDIEKSACDNDLGFKLKLSGKRITDETSITNSRNQITVTGDITFHKEPNLYCLIKDGWLPPVFVAQTIFLVDRNVVSILSKLSSGSTRRLDYKSVNWWVQFKSNIRLNPILYSFEGETQQTPTYREFCSQFKKATNSIKSHLPSSIITSYNTAHYKAVYDLIIKLDNRKIKELKFLKKVSSILVHRCKDKDLNCNKQKILSIADSLNIERASLVLVTALACLYERKDGSGLLVARKILKPNKDYTDQDAFNALSDLRAIELLIEMMSLNESGVSLMTCDKALAGMWCGLHPNNIRFENEELKFDFSLDKKLFPRMEDESLHKLTLDLK